MFLLGKMIILCNILHLLFLCATASILSFENQKPLARPVQVPDSSRGCLMPRRIAQPGKTKNITVISGGMKRSFLIHLPLTYQRNPHQAPLPLVLSYHGAMTNASYQQNLTRFSDPEYNAVMVYPQGINNTWEGDPGLDSTVNDVEFTSKIIHITLNTVCIDPSRIYATGKSIAGGFMDVLACSHISDRFAAFAVVSGAFYVAGERKFKDCLHKQPVTPIINTHGLADETIPYEGAKNRKGHVLPSLPAWLEGWAERNGCEAPFYAMKNTSLHNATLMQWICGDNHTSDIDHYAVEGLKHAWPALEPNEDGPASAIDGSKLIYNFFMKWTSSYRG